MLAVFSGLASLGAKLAQTQAKRVHPSQILLAVALGHRPGFERPRVHRLDEKLQTCTALDQYALDFGRHAADMPRQRRPRIRKQARFSGAPVELRQHMRPGMRAYLRNSHAAN